MEVSGQFNAPAASASVTDAMVDSSLCECHKWKIRKEEKKTNRGNVNTFKNDLNAKTSDDFPKMWKNTKWE
jgi:hypothetical protein